MTRFTNAGVRKGTNANKHESDPEKKRYKNDKRTNLRRLKRIRERNDTKICFGCRENGHSVENCLKIQNDDKNKSVYYNKKVCYKCGSKLHTLYKCKLWIKSKNSDELPYASCFICKSVGHLAVKCPSNEHGLYPNGGSCHLCKSTTHLAVNCDISANKKIDKGLGTTFIGQSNPHQNPDDDDLHITLINEKEKAAKNTLKQNLMENKKRKKIVVM